TNLSGCSFRPRCKSFSHCCRRACCIERAVGGLPGGLAPSVIERLQRGGSLLARILLRLQTLCHFEHRCQFQKHRNPYPVSCINTAIRPVKITISIPM